MTWTWSSCSLVTTLTTLQLLVVVVVVARSDSHSTPVRRPADEQIMSDDRAGTGRCYVVTIFGLKTADCGKQNARSVPASLDSDLQVLRFEDNRLTVLGDGEFSSYANLQEIYVARNRLELIESTALRGLYSLQILDLEGNQLTAVPAKSLRAVASSLRLLSLKNNPIRRLEADSLSSLTRLEEINMEDCWLEYVDPGAFSGLERLSALNLVNNELRTIDATMQSTLPSTLRVVRLYRNPWTCNCRLRWLRQWLVSATERRVHDSLDATINWDFASNTPTCSAPALIRGVAWRHLTPDQFACPSRIVAVSAAGTTSNGTATTTGLRVIAGTNATVECIAAGDPEPIVSWFRGDRDDDVLAPPKALISVRQGKLGADGEPRIVSLLTLIRVTATTDSGDYSCMAENTAGRAEMTFTLTVDSRPVAGTSTAALWPIDRDAILGTLLGLLAILCIVIICTALRLRSVARHRRRLHNKNIYYLANTGNHVGPSPTSNHRPVADVESAVAHTHLADDDSKSSDEHVAQAYLGDGKIMAGSGKCDLLPNHDPMRPDAAKRNRHKQLETNARRTYDQHSDVRPGEAQSLLNSETTTADLDLGDTNVDDRDTCRINDQDSVSEQLSDVASEEGTIEVRGNGEEMSNLRERPSRAVSFGPDMIIDAQRRSFPDGEQADSSASEHDDLQASDDNTVVQRDSDDDDATQQTRNTSKSQHADDLSVFQGSTVDSSPSSFHRPPAPVSHPSVRPDHGTAVLSPADSPRLMCTELDAQALSVGVDLDRRHSTDKWPVGNGSLRRGPAAHQLGRSPTPRSPTPQSPTTSPFPFKPRPSSESPSLEQRAKTRRRLPIPTAAVRRFPGPGVFGVGASRGRHRATPSPSPRDVELRGNHVGQSRTPVSLVEILAPPFGGGVSGRSGRRPRPTCTMPAVQKHRPTCTAEYQLDDDSGTDI